METSLRTAFHEGLALLQRYGPLVRLVGLMLGWVVGLLPNPRYR